MTRPTLSRGSTDKASVLLLQQALNANGERLTPDGDFGAGTETAVRAFQLSYGMPTTGVADDAVWRVLDRLSFGTDPAYKAHGLCPSTPVTGTGGVAKAWNSYGQLLVTLAGVLGFSPSAASAVLAVESAGAGFWNGRMVIRFENHVFRSRWGRDTNAATFGQHFRVDAKEAWKGHAWRPDAGMWRDLHTQSAGQDEEYAVLAFACTLAEESAYQSISMGAPQIMGFNHQKVGFASAKDMFAAFTDERAQVLGLFDFIRSDHKMVRALRTGDWVAFALIYNGSGQAEYYGGKIRENVAAAKALGIG